MEVLRKNFVKSTYLLVLYFKKLLKYCYDRNYSSETFFY